MKVFVYLKQHKGLNTSLLEVIDNVVNVSEMADGRIYIQDIDGKITSHDTKKVKTCIYQN